jgi:acyl carrier protein
MKDSEIKQLVSNLASLPVDALDDDELLTDLLVDSFAIIDLSIAIQDELNILFVQQDLVQIRTVSDLVSLIKSKLVNDAA